MNNLKLFVKQYFSNIVPFWVNHIVASILGISVGLATIAFNNFAVSIIGCFFTIGFLCYLHYENFFQLGVKHHYKHVDQERPGLLVGAKIALMASSPLFLLVAVGLLFQIILPNETPAVVCKFVFYVLNGMYIQLHAFLTSADILKADTLEQQCLGWFVYFLYLIPAVLSSTLAYVLGSKDRPLRTFFGIKYSGQKKTK